MAQFAKYTSGGLFAVGILTVLGGMFFRKTFAVARNLIVSPLMGFLLLLPVFAPEKAPSVILEAFQTIKSLAAADWQTAWKLVSNNLALLDADKWFFLCGTLLSAALVASSIWLPIKSIFFLRVESLCVSAFMTTLTLFLSLFSVKVIWGAAVFYIVFAALAAILSVFQKRVFDIVIICETSLIGSLLFLFPFKIKFDLHILVYLLLAFLFAAVFIIIGLVLRRRHAQAT